MRKILLLANSLLGPRHSRNLSRAIRALEDAGVELDIQQAGANRAGGEKARRAAAGGVDAVIVAGGDGTIFDVLQGIAGTSVPLGILPLGTGNVLAQNLKIPKDPASAARWILRARPVLVPLGKITCADSNGDRSWFFAMSAGMGSHAALMQAAHRLQKRVAGKAAYFAAGIKLLFHSSLQPFEAEITTTEGCVLRREVCEALAVRVAELNLWRTGGGLELPYLRVASVQGHSALRLACAAAHGLLGPGGARDQRRAGNVAAQYEDALRVVCRPLPGYRYKLPVLAQADGEVLGASYVEIEMAGTHLQLLSA